jgi:hypothetical protein
MKIAATTEAAPVARTKGSKAKVSVPVLEIDQEIGTPGEQDHAQDEKAEPRGDYSKGARRLSDAVQRSLAIWR